MATSISHPHGATTLPIAFAVLVATAASTLGLDCAHPAQFTPCPATPTRLAKGTILIASRDLGDPNFHETVVLVADYGPRGASGLVLNRPSPMTLAELLPSEESLRPRNDTIYVGGPVAQDRLILLIRSSSTPPEAHSLFDDVYISGSAATLRDLTTRTERAIFRSYMGYAGWGPGQLEDEVERGDWRILRAEAEMIFEQPSRSLWRTLIERSSGEWTMLDPTSVPLDHHGGAAATGGTARPGRLAPPGAGGQKGPEERSV